MSETQTPYMPVPYGMTVHGQEEIDAVVHVLKTSTQMGRHVAEFENRIAALFDKKYGIMVNSGSSALHLAVELLDLEPGSEVITPALTFATTVACLVKHALVPSFVDVEPGTYCIDTDRIEEQITSKTKAMLIPNLIGNLARWDRIAAIAGKHNLNVIEDSADTLGGTYKGVSSGSFSDISITSFYGSHIINCAGNGGILCVNSPEHNEEARLLRSWGRSSSLFVESEKVENRFNVKLDDIDYDAKFLFERIGYNFEPSEPGAAFGLVQLKKLSDNILARAANYQAQRQFFSQYEHWFVLPEQTPETTTGWLAFPLTLRAEAPFSRRDMQIFLEKRGIQTRVIFTGNILRQPGFKSIEKVVSREGYPTADSVTRGGVLLACHHGLNQAMLDHIHRSFSEFARRFA